MTAINSSRGDPGQCARNDIEERLERLDARRRRALAERLAEHPGAGDAQGSLASDRLVAYVVPRDGSTLSVDELRTMVGRALPDYMVPASFVLLDQLPLTPNGKIDRSALPRLDAEVLSEDSFVSPTSETEIALARIWGEVLGFESVSIRDNFFEMGGDSLLSIRVIARAADVGIFITAQQFVDNPTIEEVAAVAKRSVDNDAREPADEQLETEFPLADLDQGELQQITELLDGREEG